MDSLLLFLTEHGYLGMCIAAFIAGSFLPFSSEAVMVALLASGLDAVSLLISATVGNWAGSMFNYSLGRMGKTEWITRWLHVKPSSLSRAEHFVQGRGAWMGFFTFLPVLGTAIAVVLGLMRSRLDLTMLSVGLGKFLRYVMVWYTANLFI